MSSRSASRISRRVSRLTPKPDTPGSIWGIGLENFWLSWWSRKTIRVACLMEVAIQRLNRSSGRQSQSLSTGFLQADPVALASELRGLVTFVDRDADPGLLESLRQAQAADAAADDEDMERGWRRPRTGLAASVVSAVIFDHRSQASR